MAQKQRVSVGHKGTRAACERELGKKLLGFFEVLHMANRAEACRIVRKLVPFDDEIRRLAELARECGAGAFADDILARCLE